jgi:O-antigen/teichoic acid export membrane protein
MIATSYLHKGRYALLDRIAFSLFTLTYTFLSARIIPREQYGILMITVSVLAFLNLASEAGVGSAFVKYASEKDSDFGQVFFTALSIKLTLATAASILIAALSGLIARLMHNEGLTVPLRLLPMLIFSTSLSNAVKQGMQSRQNMKGMFLVDSISFAVLAVLYGLFLALGILDSASKVIILVSIAGFVAAFTGMAFWLARIRPHYSIDRGVISKLINFGKYSGLSELSTVVYSRIDTLMIGYFLTALAVAAYNAAWVLSYGVNLLLSAISVMAFPEASRAHSMGRKEDLKRIYETTTAVALIFTVPLCIVLVVFADRIMSVFYANRFPDAAVVLRILAIWWLVKPFGNMAGNVFYGMGKPKVLALLTSGTAVLNIFGNLFLIPRYGIVGAAWASVICFGVGVFLAYFFMRAWLEISMRNIVACVPRILGVASRDRSQN